jgi:hypothetical protein
MIIPETGACKLGDRHTACIGDAFHQPRAPNDPDPSPERDDHDQSSGPEGDGANSRMASEIGDR